MLRRGSRVPHDLKALERAVVAPKVNVTLAGGNAQLLGDRVHAIKIWQEWGFELAA